MREPDWLVWLRRTVGRPLHTTVHFGLLLALPIIGIVLARDLAGGGRPSCDFGDTAYLPDWTLMAWSIPGLVAGRYFSWLRPAEDFARPPSLAGHRAGMVALILGCLALAIIWLYEAVGTAHVTEEIGDAKRTFEPITFYVRCAIYHDKATAGGFWTVFTILVASFVVGHWLWSQHPGDTKPEPVAARAKH